jgi:hypothetical protein
LSGSLVLETSNGGNAAFNTGKWAGCDFSNQQSPNPNSSNPSAPYGLSGFSGGVTADWGPCADWIDEMDCSGFVCPDTVAESVTVLLGYSNTAGQVGGVGPYAVQPTTMTATSPEACAALDAPCIAAASSPGNSGTAADGTLTIGCTLGDWNIYAPWNPTSFSLTNAPSAYQEQSQMLTQLGYVATNSSGKVALAQVPPSVEGGGATKSGFDANVPNSFTLNSADLTAIEQSVQQSLGQGAYVAQWVCAMTAFSTVPTLANVLDGGSNQPNLGWYGSAVYAAIENPAGNMLSKAGSTPSSVGSTSGAPSGVNAVAGNGQVVVSWNPVTATSGTSGVPEVAYTAAASSGQSCTSAGLTCTISGVPNGIPVTVTVTAAVGGTSATSPPTSPVTPQSSASTPSPTSGAQNVTVNASNNTVNVAWNPAVTRDGAKAPVSYTAISSTGQSCTTTGTACTIAGVPAGATPQVRVVTTTSQGYGAPAAAGSSSTGAPPSPLQVSDSTPRSAKARSIITVKVKAGPGAADGKARISLMRGDKVVARLGAVTVINGSGVNKLKIPKRVKKGSYKLAVSFVDQETGQIGNTSSAIQIKKKARKR